MSCSMLSTRPELHFCPWACSGCKQAMEFRVVLGNWENMKFLVFRWACGLVPCAGDGGTDSCGFHSGAEQGHFRGE